MAVQQFEVRKEVLSDTRIASYPLPTLASGELLCKVERFALTANNVTYALMGDKMAYWEFFPAQKGWGTVPVWGFAEVQASKHPDVPVGDRLYGYFPMATHIKMRPEKVTEARLRDASAHRAALPPVYNMYARTHAEPSYDRMMDDERILLFPLFATSFCLFDFLNDKSFFSASQIVIPCGSSKTAIGLAYALQGHNESLRSVALTSKSKVAKLEALALYDTVLAYDELASVDAQRTTVIVDMAGNGNVLSQLHSHLGDQMLLTLKVGMTHHDATPSDQPLIRERTEVFFAPSHIQKRAGDWGPGVFEKRALAFWSTAARRSRDWLSFEHHYGLEGLATAYSKILSGDVSADRGVIVLPACE